jgi:hypothetical protein
MNFAPASGSTCFGSLQSVGSGSQNIYGDVFFVSFIPYPQKALPLIIILERILRCF